MISAFFSVTFMLIGVALIGVIKLYTFTLYRLVPVVGLIYLGMAVAQAEENPFSKYAPHLLVVITAEDMVELSTKSTRQICVDTGILIMQSGVDNYIGFVCEVIEPDPEPEPPKMSAVCHEEVQHCA